MKKKLSLFLAAYALACSFLLMPVRAEDTPPEGSMPSDIAAEPKPTESKSTEPTVSGEPKPTESEPPASTAPTQESTSTEPSLPPCTTHTYDVWDADEHSHWHSCTKCGHRESSGHSWAAELITVAPTCKDPGGKCKICTVCQGILVTKIIPMTENHTYDNECDSECNVCGLERQVPHAFGKTWTHSGKGHWHTCTICGAAGEVKDHYPGPAATEEKDQICLTCGRIMMKKKAHTHKWDPKWSSDADNHWYVCTVCEEKDKTAPHNYDDGCDTDCNDCGYVRTAAHIYGPDWSRTELTHYGVCTACGEEGAAEDHIADSIGTKCSICGYAMEAETDIHEHIFAEDTWDRDEAEHWNACMCGEKGNAAAHIWDEGKKNGRQITHTCEVCGAEKTEEVPESSFPWLLIAVGGGVLICLTGIVVCIVLIIRNRKYEE